MTDDVSPAEPPERPPPPPEEEPRRPGEPPRDEPPADVDLRRPEAGAPEEQAPLQERRKFGTFGGVFTPTVLTILGVIMYLREGWVIGNAGILGGLLIILLAFGITTLTALSMSSITTNIRLGAGGAYAIIAQSLGLEIGGALGIPRYLSQALAVTMYIFGLREGWRWVFPDHPAFLVDLVAFAVLFAIAYKSAWLAMRVQYVIMAVIAASLVSIGVAAAQGSMQYPIENVGLWGDFRGAPETGFRGTSFWIVFAVFFPASTGIMAGANMSGDLKDPRRSIPRGTLWAIGVSLAIYLALAYWLARSATPEELTSNYTVMIDKAAWGPAVLAGLLGATFSSALASLVGSARILMAMGEHRVLPAGRWLERKTATGEPRNAMVVTGVILFLSILLRDLNAVAPLVTMFFLITYAMLNGVLLVEQSLELVSFRPRLRVPRWVPLLGLVGSLFAMFIVNPTVSWVSIAIVMGFYWLLLRSRLEAPFTDVRSGLFVSVAEWAARKVSELPGRQERAWKPNLLVPVESPIELRGSYEIISSIALPKGTVKVMGLCPPGSDPETLADDLERVGGGFRERGVFATTTVIDPVGGGERFADRLIGGMQTLRGVFFRPNVVFLRMGWDHEEEARQLRESEIRRIVQEAERERIGTLLYAPHPVTGLAQRAHVNVWIRDRGPDWKISWDVGNMDLSLLIALKLKRNWDARLRLLMVVGDESEVAAGEAFLEDLISLARLDAAVSVEAGDFGEWLPKGPQADVSVFGITGDPDFEFVRRAVEGARSTCLFVRDSGEESVLA